MVCTEAGLGLNAALQRVARELAVSHPALAEEMALVNAEIRAGVDRVEALGNLAKRTGLEDVRGFVTLLAQSLRFGTSVAETLRIYSEEFRDKRMQRAEEVSGQDWDQDDLSTRHVPVSRVFHHRYRTSSA